MKETLEDLEQDVSLGRYRLLRRLGGSNVGGEVFLAQAVQTKERAVLRVFPVGFDGAESLREGALARMKIRHPALVPLREVGAEGGRVVLVSPVLVGASLSRVFESLDRAGSPVDGFRILDAIREQLEPADRNLGDLKFWARDLRRIVVDLAVQLAKALDQLHAAGFAHGNLKSSNVFLTPYGRILLLDTALRAGQAASVTDVGGFGEVFSGLIRWVPAPRPRDLELIRYAANPEYPADRYRSAGEIVRDLQRFQDGEPVMAPRPGLMLRAARAAGKNPARTAAAFFLFAIVGGAALLTLNSLALREREQASKAAPQAADPPPSAQPLEAPQVEVPPSERKPSGPSASSSPRTASGGTGACRPANQAR